MNAISRLTALLLTGILWTVESSAVTLPTPQFDVLGFIQEATLDTTGAICTPDTDPATGLPSERLRGGTMMVNGQKLIIPCNTLLQLPAATMMWADLFDPAISVPVSESLNDPTDLSRTTLIGSVPAQPFGQSGLALTDNPMPFPSFEVRAQGNVVDGRYIVGLIVPITQQGLNAISGLISYIDYTIGAFRVGGIPDDPACSANGILSPDCSGALVQVNDPVGRWGKIHSPDPRFSGDYENSTVSATTGIPVCIPRVDPAVGIDPECPLGNRPLNGDPRFPVDPFLEVGAPLKIFNMPSPIDSVFPDARLQVPMRVGDQVDIAGTLFKIDPAGDESAANSYISAHTVGDNLGIFTAPGIPPAYVGVEDLLIGTNGAAIEGISQEASTRLTVVGFTSDPTRLVNIYAQDVNACTGEASLRWLATTDPSTQPIRGRFVYRVLGGDFMPPTRNYVIKSLTQRLDSTTGLPQEIIVANGIVAGQFLLPNFEFIFPENHKIGDPLIPFNFQDLPFLAQGSGPVDGAGSGSPVLGQLNPWPGAATPPKAVCVDGGAAPLVNAGADITVLAGATVTLGGTVTLDPNGGAPTIAWTAPAGIILTNAGTLTPSFTPPVPAGGTPMTLAFQLTVTDSLGSGTNEVVVTVNPAGDTVNIATATWSLQSSKRGQSFGKLAVTATSTDPTAILELTETGTDGIVYSWGTGTLVSTSPTLATFSWNEVKGVQQPESLTVRSDKGGSMTVSCGVPTDTKGTVTCQ